MKVVGIIQARTSSTRLPGKVLMDLAGQPMLARVVERVARAERLDRVVVATSDEAADDPIEELCRRRDWNCFRGSRDDVLDRFLQAAEAFEADAVVRVTSDCPLIDPGVIDEVVDCFIEGGADIDCAANTQPRRTFPRGLDTSATSMAALRRVWSEAGEPRHREHVTLYMFEHLERFRIKGVFASEDFSEMRWTVDTAEDFQFMAKVFQHFGNSIFNWKEVLPVLSANPAWAEINRHIKQKEV